MTQEQDTIAPGVAAGGTPSQAEQPEATSLIDVLAATCQWIRWHPGASACGAAGLTAAFLTWSAAGHRSLAAHAILALIAALTAAGIAAAIALRIHYAGSPPGSTTARQPATAAGNRATVPAQAPAGPQDRNDPITAAARILVMLRPGPEPVRFADPAATLVRWDTGGPRSRDLDPARADKMRIICARFRRAASVQDILHQLPQLLLAASDGAVIELLGGRTGIIAADGDDCPGGLA
jgi:hypothetical protein